MKPKPAERVKRVNVSLLAEFDPTPDVVNESPETSGCGVQFRHTS